MRICTEVFLDEKKCIVYIVQIRSCEIETCDEIALTILQETVFYATIQTVPVTLPKPIPKTIPKVFLIQRIIGKVLGEDGEVTTGINAKGEKILKE